MEKHPLQLKNPELQTSPEVERAVERKERRTGEKLPNDPAERIEAYLGRLENIFLNSDQRVRERNLEMFRAKIYDALIIKPEQVPDSYFELQKQVAREHGVVVEEVSPEMRDQMIETVIADQKHSLDQWMEYLTSDDVAYPPWFKYLVWRNVVKLSQFDKTLGKFKDRTESTVAPYPDIYRAPLAKILDIYEEAVKDKTKLKDSELQANFSKRFAKLYAELISESLAINIENKEQVKGKWIKYNKGNTVEADRLFGSVQAKGTGWCIEGRTTARNYVEQGDFYVYYTEDKNGQPTQPRVAIQMNGSQIGQIRGILAHQELEPAMADILADKLKEFGPEADSYKKKNADMKKMTEIEKKSKSQTPLVKEDLIFLYEIDAPIEGFGYDRDPRIVELRAGRNPQKDMLAIFDCTESQIAHNSSEITEDIKAYVGPLEPGIFQKLPAGLEHVYTSFPDKKIKLESAEIGGKTAEQLISEMEQAGINISDYAKLMLKSPEFVVSKNRERITLINLSVADLGFTRNATTTQIYERAQALGLELCSVDTGPNYRLQYQNQPMGEWVRIGMKQINDRDGSPYVFNLERHGGGLWLYHTWAKPGSGWYPGNRFIFRLRKVA